MGVWIESDVDLADHPKTLRLMDALKIDCQQAVGALHLLWHFTMKYAWRDGDLVRFGVVAVAKGARWSGDPHAFVLALQESGWLDELKIHDWLDSAGRLVNDRLYNEKRKKKSGRRNADRLRRITAYKSPVTPLPNPTQPNLTVPNKTKEETLSGPRPETDIQRLIKGWKMLVGIPTEGLDSQAWDKVHFPRYAKSAQSLLNLFGFDDAINCMEFVYEHMKKSKLDCTIETIVKRSDLYRERLAKSGV